MAWTSPGFDSPWVHKDRKPGGLSALWKPERRRANPAVLHMAAKTAKGLVHHARLLAEQPLAY